MATRDQFLALIDRSAGPDACWPWLGGTDGKGGYGMARYGGRSVRPHRVSYSLANGPIPSGLTIDHLCRNRLCQNPAHLEAVTRGENAKRGIAAIGTRTHCRKGGHAYAQVGKPVNGHCPECRREYNREFGRRRRRAAGVPEMPNKANGSAVRWSR